jgi:G3E family GTPase
VLADVEQIRANAAHKYLSDTIDRQLAQANILLLTKTDLVSDAEIASVTGWLRKKVPATRILPVQRGEVPTSTLLGAIPLPARYGAPARWQGHSLFASTVLTPTAHVDAQALASALAADPSITRAKGFVATADGIALVHVVGARHSVEGAQGDHAIGLVCIGLKDVFDAVGLQALVA